MSSGRGQPGLVRSIDEDELPDFDEVTEAEDDLKRRIDEAETINAVTDLMLDGQTQGTRNGMPHGTREVRDYAIARLVALGWPSRKKPAARKAA